MWVQVSIACCPTQTIPTTPLSPPWLEWLRDEKMQKGSLSLVRQSVAPKKQPTNQTQAPTNQTQAPRLRAHIRGKRPSTRRRHGEQRAAKHREKRDRERERRGGSLTFDLAGFIIIVPTTHLDKSRTRVALSRSSFQVEKRTAGGVATHLPALSFSLSRKKARSAATSGRRSTARALQATAPSAAWRCTHGGQSLQKMEFEHIARLADIGGQSLQKMEFARIARLTDIGGKGGKPLKRWSSHVW